MLADIRNLPTSMRFGLRKTLANFQLMARQIMETGHNDLHNHQNPNETDPHVEVPKALNTEVPKALGEFDQLVEQLNENENTNLNLLSRRPNDPLPANPEATTADDAVEARGELAPGMKEERVALRRLGVNNGLFVALQAKHAPTASHCLRVALSCSAWAKKIELPQGYRDILEVGALLHDIGKIGVPDSVLFKPRDLTVDDLAQLDRYRTHTLEILVASGARRELIDTVFYSSAWFDGSRRTYELNGDQIPLASRMLAIVDAFDSMTTDQVHRKGRSTDESITELYRAAGSQFDPDLVKSYTKFIDAQPEAQRVEMADCWLKDIANRSDEMWSNQVRVPRLETGVEQLFNGQMMEMLGEAAIFVDAQRRVTLWNDAAERITGISQEAAIQKVWLPSLLAMRDEEGNEIVDSACPVAWAMSAGENISLKAMMTSRTNKTLHVDIRCRPIMAADGATHGAAIVFDDLSSEVTLSKRLEALNARVIVDPLTKIANRAEIDRVHNELVRAAFETQSPFSMMICDLDFFKSINDEYGHPAGDEALMHFAALLRRFKRTGDLVGRYGGEEFVMLCADCELTSINQRADNIRKKLAGTPLPFLDHKCITASFGVTQLQPGDSAASMLRRADRALLKAKETGRNRVIQMGGTATEFTEEAPEVESTKQGFLDWFRASKGTTIAETQLVTTVPIELAIEKFRGYVSDQGASIISVDGNHVQIRAEGGTELTRRSSDRAVPFLVDLEFKPASEHHEKVADEFKRGTTITLQVQTIRSRDRRKRGLEEQVRHLIASLKSYFMAAELRQLGEPNIERAAKGPGR